MNPRDTQFQEFAKLLWDELINANNLGYIDVNTGYDDGIDPTNYRQIIARRAYDLVKHAFEDVDSVTIQFEEVPDMTELPKEQDG